MLSTAQSLDRAKGGGVVVVVVVVARLRLGTGTISRLPEYWGRQEANGLKPTNPTA